MSAPIRLAVVGLGTHGRSTCTVASAAGACVTGAADPAHAGRDLGELVGVPSLGGVTVGADLDAIAWAAVDVAVIAVKLPVGEVAGVIERVLAHGADVITIVEDLFDLDSFAPELRERLDRTAKAAGHTVVATGSQDAGWGGIALHATALVRDLRGIHLRQHVGVDGYPEEFLRWCGIGVDRDEWQDAADVAAETPSVFGAILPVLTRKLGFTVTEQSREMQVITQDEPFSSVTYGRDIPAGQAIGRRDLVTLQTAEGIAMTAELSTSAVLGDDVYTLTLDAYPSLELRHRIEPGHASVDATVINRLPDVLAAPPGLVATVDLPTPYYRSSLG